MKKRILSFALALALLLAVLPFAANIAPETVAQGGTFVLPLTGGSPVASAFNSWSVENTPGLTNEMLLTANELRVVTTLSNTAFNGGRGLSLYVNGVANGWWDDTHIIEIGQQTISGTSTRAYIFNLEWKRPVFGNGSPGDSLTLGCAWWNQAWATTRGQIQRIELVWGQPNFHTPVGEIGVPLTNPGGEVDNIPGITASDVTMLRRFIAATNKQDFIAANQSSFDPAQADVNGDGVINSADSTLLRRYIAGADVMLGETFVPIERRPIQANAKWYVAITIDDGPVIGPSTTGATALQFEALANARAPDGTAARATWFHNPRRMTDQVVPLIQRMTALGHDIENHSWSHGQSVPGPNALTCRNSATQCAQCRSGDGNCWTGISRGASNTQGFNAADFTHDAITASRRIRDVTGRWPIYYRFGQFVIGGGQPAILNGLRFEGQDIGMRVIHAQMDSRDFNTPAISTVVNLLRNGGAIDGANYGGIAMGGWNGVIMLFHDAGGDASSHMYTINNAAIFSQAVPHLQSIGYAFVTVEELVRIKNATPATGGSGARFNGHFGTMLWRPYYPGDRERQNFFDNNNLRCPPGVACANTLC